MSSTLILKIHLVSITVFLDFYLLKTFFLLTGKLPAYSGLLSEEEIHSISEYILTLRK
ncbi:MAG TPA: hypothetical protein VI757_06185 [Bacteroidia bacterium]|nr:hypothetical protein [Bacteroidia bacterium]